MDVLLSPSSPMPAWASQCHASLKVRKVCRPNPTQFKRFVQALGTRYSGTYHDENEGGAVLPRVSRWSVWNEPNQGGWLQPQRRGTKARSGRARAVPRAGARRCDPRPAPSGHGSDEILFGETAPIGRTAGPRSRPPPPARDVPLRGVLCLDAHDRTRAAARGRRRWGAGGRLRAPGRQRVAHHPYTRGGAGPHVRGVPAEITISSISRLKRRAPGGAKHGAARRPADRYTEFGFQTDPPDACSASRWPSRRRASTRRLLAWRDPSVRAVVAVRGADEPRSPPSRRPALPRRPSEAVLGHLPPAALGRPPRLEAARLGPAARGHRRCGRAGRRPERADGKGRVHHGPDRDGSRPRGLLNVKLRKRSGVWHLASTPSTGGTTIFSRVARPGDEQGARGALGGAVPRRRRAREQPGGPLGSHRHRRRRHPAGRPARPRLRLRAGRSSASRSRACMCAG